jgi:PKD repeat protein
MKRILGLAALAVFCALLSTCGTYRAITGDYEQDYIIRDIKPLSGVSGQQVTFDASICATAGSLPIDSTTNPPHFVWDFGGGADPNVSYDAKPAVNLRAGGAYDGTLTIRDGCVGDRVVSATFTMNVTPLSVLTVTPTSGVSGGTANFTALIGSGAVTGYAWDFGGAALTGATNTANPNVTFGAPGSYDASVIVSNNYEAVQFPFTLTIVAATP